MSYSDIIPKFKSKYLKDGSLQFESSADALAHVEISAWRDGLMPRVKPIGGKLRSDKKTHILKNIVLIQNEHLKQSALPVHHFIRQIPDNIVQEIKSIPYLQFYVLRVFHHHPEAIDLLVTNWALFYLKLQQIANDGFEHWLKYYCRENLSAKRIEILNSITGQAANRSSINLLRKIPRRKVNHESLNSILKFVKNPLLVEKVSHLKLIPVSLIEKLLQFPGLVICPYFYTICLVERDDRSRVAPSAHTSMKVYLAIDDMIHDASRVQMDIWRMEYPGRPDLIEPLSRVKTLTQLNRLHDKISNDFKIYKKKHLQAEVFCEPPIPGIENKIEAITNAFDLLVESEKQKNCVSSFTPNPHSYYYRQLIGERCTIRIVFDPVRERFVLDEIKAACNRPAHPSSISFVNRWLSHEQDDEKIRHDRDKLYDFEIKDYDRDKIYDFVIKDMEKNKHSVRFRERYSVESLQGEYHLLPAQAEELHELLISKGRLIP